MRSEGSAEVRTRCRGQLVDPDGYRLVHQNSLRRPPTDSCDVTGPIRDVTTGGHDGKDTATWGRGGGGLRIRVDEENK